MKNDQPGQIVPGLWCLGRPESTVYLLQAPAESILISGGTSYILPDVLKQLERFGLNPDSISKCLILHAHFDHIGIIPYFKRQNPGLEIFASRRGWDILGMDKAIKTINQFSRMTARRMNLEHSLQGYDLDWGHDISGSPIAEGDHIEVGGWTIQILETPGHSSCSVSGYIPRIKAVFPSDGGGIPYGDEVIPSGNSNYTLYQNSLNKLLQLEVDIHCADHYGYLTGADASGFIRKSIRSADAYRRLVEKVYQRKQDIDSTVEHLVRVILESRPDYFLPKDILTGVTKQVVKHIATHMDT